MKRQVSLCFIVIFIGLFCIVISCQKMDSKVIDQQYLNSKSYTQFRNKAANEYKDNRNRDNSLVQLFKTFPKCTHLPQIALPATINLKRVKALQKKGSDNCSYSIGSRPQKILVKFIAESSLQNKKIRWILTDHDKLYQDQRLWVAVYKKPDILGFCDIGAFQHNISKEVRTEITAELHSNKVRITTFTTWQQKYPIKQSNTFKSRYEITENGKILRR